MFAPIRRLRVVFLSLALLVAFVGGPIAVAASAHAVTSTPYAGLQLRVDPAAIKAAKGKSIVATLAVTNNTGSTIAKGTTLTFTFTGLKFKSKTGTGDATLTGGATVTGVNPVHKKTPGTITATLDADLAAGSTLNLTLTVTGKGSRKLNMKATLTTTSPAATFSSNSVTGIKTDGSMQLLKFKKSKTGLTLTGSFFANNEPVTVTVTPALSGAPTSITADANGNVSLTLSGFARKTKYTVTLTGQWSGVTSVVNIKSR